MIINTSRILGEDKWPQSIFWNPEQNTMRQNRIVFHMVFAHKDQQRSGNAEQALIEYVHARQKWREQTKEHFEEHGESIETWNSNPAGEEPGTKKNKFKAGNGVTFWYEEYEFKTK